MESYSPFDKSTVQATADLVVLKSVREGWYVEYKRQIPSAASIAKSISAFANTYGGWLFYGITEKAKDEAVAGSFDGIPCAELDAFQQTIRQAAATLISPSPHFELSVHRGPCPEIGLAHDRAIVCLRIPRSLNTPHVHKSGQIYRRVSDGSEPKPESDRFILDQLWRRADELRSSYRTWINRTPELSKGEAEAPFVRLLIVPDLWGDQNIQINFDVDHIRHLINDPSIPGITVPFETVYTSAKGITARQNNTDGPHNAGLIWKFWPDLSSEVLLPLYKFEIEDLQTIPYHLEGYQNNDRLREVLEKQHYQHAIRAIIAYFEVYTELYHHPLEDQVFARLKLRDPAAAASIGDLAREHRKGSERLRRVAQAVDGVLADREILRQDVDAIVRDFLEHERHHMAMEDRHFFPAAAKALKPDDWAEIASAQSAHKDPLFSDATETRFDALRAHIFQLEQEAESERG